MKKSVWPVLLCATLFSPLLVGCHNDNGAKDYSNASKADFEKAAQPDPAKMQEMANKYRNQGPPPGAAQPGTPARH